MYNQCEVLVRRHQCTHKAIDGDGRPKCQYHTKRLMEGRHIVFMPVEQVTDRSKFRTLLPRPVETSDSDVTGETAHQHTNNFHNQQIQNPLSIPTTSMTSIIQRDNNILDGDGRKPNEKENIITARKRTLELKF